MKYRKQSSLTLRIILLFLLYTPFCWGGRNFGSLPVGLLPDNKTSNSNNTVTNRWQPRLIDNYTDYNGGVLRTTTSRIEGNGQPETPKSYGFVYMPVEKGKKYRIIAYGEKVYLNTWAVLAFSLDLPSSGGSITIVKSYETDGYVNFDELYTPTENGYLLASYFHSDGFEGVSSVYKFIEQNTEEVVTAEANMYTTVYEGLSKGDDIFNVGQVMFKNTSEITSFIPNSFEEQYESQYAKYANNSIIKHFNKMAIDRVVDLFDNNLDAVKYVDSYCRQIIGVDSEGWSYIAQRRSTYDFETDEITKILRTKDFNTFEVFMEGVVGVQLIELENGELCFAANSTDTYDGVTGYYCNIYVTSNHKTVINKRFHTTRTQNGTIGQPWSWGVQSRGSVIAISEYGSHGKVGGVWYSRDFGEHFYHVFEHSMYAPNYPNAHIHGICVDPYFDRLYVITGDSKRNSRLYWWDYNGEILNDNLYNTIDWKFIETNRDCYTGCNFQFVCGYALKDCVILGSDGARGGIMRINRGSKEDTPIIDFGVDFGYAKDGQFSTVWCGGNMFKLNDESPLLMCIHREASNDLEPNDPNNPSHYANTYRTVLSKVYATYNGYDFSLLWEDDTYGQYDVWETDDNWATQRVVRKNLAKCGRDMSIYQLPDSTLLLKYTGRAFSYTSYNDNGKTNNTRSSYHRFNNCVVVSKLKTVEEPVTITAKSYTREYGDANPVFEYTSEGAALVGEPEITCEATESSPIGTYDIVVKQGTVSNSNVTYIAGTLTVKKAPLNIAAGSYTKKQGDAMPEFALNYTGFKNNETKDVLTKQPEVSCNATEASAPGEYPVTVSGAEAQNYDISYTKGTLTITEADPVTITAQSYTREYGDANPVFEYTSEGAALVGEPEIICEATETSPIGTYDIVVKQGTVKNYNVTYVDGSLTVTKAPLAVKAGEYKIKQGEAFPEFTASYTGFKNNETETVLTKLPTLSTTATSESEPGTYEVVVSGAEAQNYDISYINGILVVEENLAGIAQVMMDKNDNVMIFTIDGRRVDKPKKGLYVVRMKDGTIRKVGLWKSGIW